MHNYEKLLSKIRNNEVVLWVGAGFSKYAGVPMGGELVETIKDEAVDYEKQILKDINLLPDVAEEFVKMRNNTKTDLISILKKALLFDIDNKKLFVHSALKNIPQINTIITTNFDNLFEQIYKNDLEVIIKDESISTAFSSANKDKVKLLKIHSDFTNPDLMIVTKADYTKFFEQEWYRPLWTEIKSIIAKKSILFVGYSMEDQNIRYIFNKVLNKLGTFSNECFFASPNCPEYKQKDLSKFNISYIPMGAEELIPKIEKDIKSHLIEDVKKGNIDYKVTKSMLEKNGVKANFQIKDDNIILSGIKSLDKLKKLEGNIKFKGVQQNSDYIESMSKLRDLLQGKSLETVCIPGEFVSDFGTRVADIPLNESSEMNLMELKLVPTPKEEYDCEIYFGEDTEPEIGICKLYVSKYAIKQEIIHNCFEFSYIIESCEEKEIKFKIEIKKTQCIFEGNRVIKKLLKWFNGEKVQIYKKDNYEVNFELPELNKDELEDIYQLCETQQFILSNLILFQRYFNIKFIIPNEITDEDIENINTIKNYIKNNKKIKIEELRLKVSDTKEILDLKNSKELKIESNKIETINLFGQDIELGKPNVICNDIYISNLEELESNPDIKDIILKSETNNLFFIYN